MRLGDLIYVICFYQFNLDKIEPLTCNGCSLFIAFYCDGKTSTQTDPHGLVRSSFHCTQMDSPRDTPRGLTKLQHIGNHLMYSETSPIQCFCRQPEEPHKTLFLREALIAIVILLLPVTTLQYWESLSQQKCIYGVLPLRICIFMPA